MDPIEKKFQEAFADYQYPVDDGLWDQVLEKKNRRKPFPWMRLAAAITLLILAGILLWPEQSIQPIDVVDTPMSNETQVIQPVEQTLNTESETSLTSPVVPRKTKNQEFTRSMVHQEEPKTRATDLAKSDNPELKMEIAELPRLNRKPVQYVSYALASMALPLPDIHWSPIRSDEQTDIADVPMIQKITSDQSDVTGPERLVHVLEKNSPKFVKDIIAFGSARNTEIEINW